MYTLNSATIKQGNMHIILRKSKLILHCRKQSVQSITLRFWNPQSLSIIHRCGKCQGHRSIQNENRLSFLIHAVFNRSKKPLTDSLQENFTMFVPNLKVILLIVCTKTWSQNWIVKIAFSNTDIEFFAEYYNKNPTGAKVLLGSFLCKVSSF